ncbi:MAG: NUDIX hydrolase, partial [Nitrososphaerota archaeon]|nr:NUDIX hydrolase [Nitrososphaerota archaeon]
MSAPTRKKAQFREGNVPPSSVCLSSFVSLSVGQNILVGKVTKPEIWVDQFFMGEQYAPKIAESGKYVLPASHLAWYESPLETAERIIKEQTLLPVPKTLKLVGVQSYLSGDKNDTQNPPHWDICFVYEAKLPKSAAKKMKTPEWFAEYGFKPRSKLGVDDFARG